MAIDSKRALLDRSGDVTPDEPAVDDPGACANKPSASPLRIVRARDEKPTGDDLDLGLDEAESDRRYGREDIADK